MRKIWYIQEKKPYSNVVLPHFPNVETALEKKPLQNNVVTTFFLNVILTSKNPVEKADILDLYPTSFQRMEKTLFKRYSNVDVPAG